MSWTQADVDEHNRRSALGAASATGMLPMYETIRQFATITPRPRHERGRMNKTEIVYARWIDLQKREWLFESVTFLLGPDLRFTPDFMEIRENEVWFIDVKGSRKMFTQDRQPYRKPFSEDDALAKIKSAVQRFPMFHWAQAWKGEHGEWEEKEFLPV